MLDLFLALAFALVWIVGAVTTCAGPWCTRRRGGTRLVNHTASREALTLTDTDRFIRDQEHLLWPEKKLDHLNCSICGPGPLRQGMVPSGHAHPFFKTVTEKVHDGYGGSWKVERVKAALPEHATMVSSKVIKDDGYSGLHTLMLDLDFPVTLIESSTPGHHHLYADKLMTWPQYRGVLRAMTKAGLIEQGYYDAARRQQATMLRPPWVKKEVQTPVQRRANPSKRRPLDFTRPAPGRSKWKRR